MTLKISNGLQEDGIVVGNNYDKYGSSNPIVKWIMAGFERELDDLLRLAAPGTVHEIGCGEGKWALKLLGDGIDTRGSDFSHQVIELAKENAKSRGLDPTIFRQCNIYDLDKSVDEADVIVCCEVLEHLDNPEAGLDALHRVTRNKLIVSVPNEPLWRVLNLARGRYLSDLGNTPGHTQNWSTGGFKKFITARFDILEVRKPLPWTMLLCQPKR